MLTVFWGFYTRFTNHIVFDSSFVISLTNFSEIKKVVRLIWCEHNLIAKVVQDSITTLLVRKGACFKPLDLVLNMFFLNIFLFKFCHGCGSNRYKQCCLVNIFL